MTSKRSSSTGANRSPHRARIRTPLSRALSRAISTARRDTSIAVTLRAPRCAATIASAPLPVQTSSTEARGPTVCSRRTSASIHVSEIGRNTPGSVRILISGEVSRVGIPSNLSAEVAQLRTAFEADRPPLTVGIEEELMLLHPETFDLEPRALEVLARLDGDARFKREMPAAQLEIAGPPAPTVREAAAAVLDARRVLAAAAGGIGAPAGAGVHPFAAG